MKSEVSKHEGHRKRMLRKAEDSGLEFLPEHEQLEILLFAVIPRGNTNGTAIDLIRCFGSIAGVVFAEPEELKKIDGVGNRAALFLSQLPDTLGIVQRAQMFGEKKLVVLETADDRGSFALSLFQHEFNERFYLISLSYSGRVIGCDRIFAGDEDDLTAAIREIARYAVLREASTVVLVHNHLGGRCLPSLADIQKTRDIAENLRVLGIPVKDHIIVSGGEWLSMEQEGMLAF